MNPWSYLIRPNLPIECYATDSLDDLPVFIAFLPTWQCMDSGTSPDFICIFRSHGYAGSQKHPVESLSNYFDKRFGMTLENKSRLHDWLDNCFYILGMSSSKLIFIFFRGIGIPPTRWTLHIQNPLIFGLWRWECTLTSIEPRARPATSLFTAPRHDDLGAHSGLRHGGERRVYHGVHPRFYNAFLVGKQQFEFQSTEFWGTYPHLSLIMMLFERRAWRWIDSGAWWNCLSFLPSQAL